MALVIQAGTRPILVPGPGGARAFQAQEGYATTTDSVRLWYRIVGSGAETVLAPAAAYHGRSLDGLTRGRRLVLYDSRSRGRSDWVPPSKMTLEHRLLDIEAVSRAVGADSFAMIAWSGLGPDAVAYALGHLAQVTRLVLLTPLPPRQQPHLTEIRARARARSDTAASRRLDARVAAGEFAGRQADLCREQARLSNPGTFADPAMARLAPDVCEYSTEWPERYGQTAAAAMASFATVDWRPRLGELRVPYLVVHGAHDTFPLEGSREWVAGQPNGRLLLLTEAGHWPQYEVPGRLIPALDEFLRGQWPAGAESVPAAAPSQGSPPSRGGGNPLAPSAGLVRWARAAAVPLPAIESSYDEASYRALGRMIGAARVVSLGEMIHGAREPLVLRNHLVRYAVTHLGLTAVALESGFTEGVAVDRYVQGGPGNLDSVVAAGFTSGFNALPEQWELVRWLRDHNARAARKVHLYGIDVPGDVGGYDGAPRTVTAALEFLESVVPAAGASLRGRLGPLLDRFTMAGYSRYSNTERTQLRQGLVALERALVEDSARLARAASPLELARARRTAWNARWLETSLALRTVDEAGQPGPVGSRVRDAIRLRDSVMFENVRWVVGQQPRGGRVLVFSHNGHAMDLPLVFPAAGAPMTMMGQRLRAWLGRDLVIIGTAARRYEGLTAPFFGTDGRPSRDSVPSDMSSFEAALGQLGLGTFGLDLRSADGVPEVAAMLRGPWTTRIHAWYQPMAPRRAADVFVMFDRAVVAK